MTMVEPRNLLIQIIDFSYDSLNSQDIADLTMDLNFKDYDIQKVLDKDENGKP